MASSLSGSITIDGIQPGWTVKKGSPSVRASFSASFAHNHQRSAADGSFHDASEDPENMIPSSGTVTIVLDPMEVAGGLTYDKIIQRLDAKSREECITCSKSPASTEPTLSHQFRTDHKGLNIEWQTNNTIMGCPKIHIQDAPSSYKVEMTEEDFASFEQWKDISITYGKAVTATKSFCESCSGLTDMSVFRDVVKARLKSVRFEDEK
ncbi:hypothetical protein V865_005889 [Kwoniella europaea PYCC6329]|uniref:Uncharacterized protein n=1 Tax=Kwoniella europaea PYCC6329 TaxID=1423913 RepID=A0AAX4KQB2_9TREE